MNHPQVVKKRGAMRREREKEREKDGDEFVYTDYSVNMYGEGAQCERKRERTENGGMKNISGVHSDIERG